MNATTSPESTPPESSAPSGTSLMSRMRTDSLRRRSSSSSASPSLISSLGSHAGRHQRRFAMPAPETHR